RTTCTGGRRASSSGSRRRTAKPRPPPDALHARRRPLALPVLDAPHPHAPHRPPRRRSRGARGASPRRAAVGRLPPHAPLPRAAPASLPGAAERLRVLGAQRAPGGRARRAAGRDRHGAVPVAQGAAGADRRGDRLPGRDLLRAADAAPGGDPRRARNGAPARELRLHRVPPLRGAAARRGAGQRLLAVARAGARRARDRRGDPADGPLHPHDGGAPPAAPRAARAAARVRAGAPGVTAGLDAYAPFVGAATIEELRLLGDRLRGRRVQNINSTAVGGGVAEILNRMIPLLREVGVDARWDVIRGGDEFFAVTKTIHNALHGQPVALTEHDVAVFREATEQNLRTMTL